MLQCSKESCVTVAVHVYHQSRLVLFDPSEHFYLGSRSWRLGRQRSLAAYLSIGWPRPGTLSISLVSCRLPDIPE